MFFNDLSEIILVEASKPEIDWYIG